jgi:hypothetical protein
MLSKLLLIVVTAISVAACGDTIVRHDVIQRKADAELTRPCPREPELREFMDDRDYTMWLEEIRAAGEDCRIQSDKQTKWIKVDVTE